MTLPEPSRASREFPLRSTASFRGTIVDWRRNRQFAYESLGEYGFMSICLTSTKVDDYLEQPEPIRYRLPDGRWAEHTFDGLVLMKSGRRLAVDYKPKKKIERSEIETIQKLIREQVGSDFADQYVIRSEEHIHPDDVFDAELVLHAHRQPCVAADELVTEIARELRGWCRVRDLVAAAGIGAKGFDAAVRLIGDGYLEVREMARVSYECFVRRTPRLSLA